MNILVSTLITAELSEETHESRHQDKLQGEKKTTQLTFILRTHFRNKLMKILQ